MRRPGRGYSSLLDGGGGGRRFTPADLPDVAYWCRADLDASVGSWICQITGVDFAQATPAKQPALNASVAALNNQPAFEFRTVSATELVANNALADWRFLHEGPMCVCMPFVARGTFAAKSLWGSGDSSTSGSVGACVQPYSGATDYVTEFNVSNPGGRVVDSQPAITGGTLQDTYRTHTYSYEFGATPEFVNQLDTTVLQSGGSAKVPTAGNPNGVFRLGASVDGARNSIRFGNHDCPEFVIFSAVPSAATLTTLLNYYDSRYL